MGWAMLYLFFFLKLPILALGWIVWWAVHQQPDEVEGGDGGGGKRRAPRHPRPPRPRPHRRDPHGASEPFSPPRVRSITAAGRALEHRR